MKIKKLTLMALLTAASLIVFTIEAQLPPLTAIPGIKIGLANVFTLFALIVLGPGQAFCILVVRVLLGGLLIGQPASIIYSMAGGLLSLLISMLIKRFFKENSIWALSGIAGVLHNVGQLIAAVLITGTAAIAAYLPVLIISGLIAGSFTGFCVQLVIERLRRIGKIPNKNGHVE